MGTPFVILVIGALAFAPAIFWLWYFRQKDFEPEPLHLIRNCFILGMLAVVVAGFVEHALSSSTFLTLVVVAPIVEELGKFLVVYLYVFRRSEFNEPMDGVIYAVAVALGFASLENAGYLYEAYETSYGELSLVTILRAFFSVPAHALFGVVWGYALGVAKFSERPRETYLVILGLLLGILFHSIFNGLALLGPLWPFGMLILIPILWQVTHRRIEAALHISPHASADGYAEKLRALKPKLESAGEKAWYHNRAVVLILMFFLCFPIGWYGLIKNGRFSTPEKVTLVALWLVMAFMLVYAAE